MKTFEELAAEMPLPDGFKWFAIERYLEAKNGYGIKKDGWWHFGIQEDRTMFAHHPDGEQETMREKSAGDMESDMRLMYGWFLMGMYSL